MVRAPTVIVPPSTTLTLRGVHQRKKSSKLLLATESDSYYVPSESFVQTMDDDMYDDDFDGDDDGGVGSAGKGRNKSRRELPTGAVETLKAWLLAPEHFTHPYPTPQDQAMLMQKTGIDKKQLKNWFTNARRRIWKPMLKKQIESGTIVANVNSNFSGLPVAGTSSNPGASMDNPHSVQAVRVHYQQAMQDQNLQRQQQVNSADTYGNPMYTSSSGDSATNVGNQYYSAEQVQQGGAVSTLAQLSSNGQLSKADSHAVLMELFARDQDLVRQATESARLKAESKQQQQQQQQETQAAPASQQQSSTQQAASAAPTNQHPMMKAPSGLLGVPSLNSWPHFSSITSLNNLGTIPGVKSITSLSGVDLASKGNLNKMGNIAQVKSMESMGNNDSYAFLELFFGDRSSTNLSGMGGIGGSSNKGMLSNKQHGDDDNEIGLSLEDESPSHTSRKEFLAQSSLNQNSSFGSSGTSNVGQQDSGYLKRAYDDALAARGLISVSRSCEKLTDLELPVKIQRTLSQNLLNIEQEQQMRQQAQQQQYQENLEQSYGMLSEKTSSHQYPGQQATEPNGNAIEGPSSGNSNSQDEQVQVSSSIACALCSQTKIDTQLRPCGHMFHERCLKPNLTTSGDQPKCPIDDIPIHSAVLAVPDNNYVHQSAQSTDAS